jgi:hypothetical protein
MLDARIENREDVTGLKRITIRDYRKLGGIYGSKDVECVARIQDNGHCL